MCTALVNQLNRFADKETLIQFLRCFLLESNSSSVRWQAHCLTLHIYRWASAGSAAAHMLVITIPLSVLISGPGGLSVELFVATQKGVVGNS